MLADWECRGSKKKINEKWIGPLVTKALITERWRLNGLIDLNSSKPAELSDALWNKLVIKRRSEAAKKKSEHMRSISKGRGSKAAQLKAIEKAALVKLVRSCICFVDKHVQYDVQ